MMTLAQAAAWLPGSVLIGDPATPITRVHTDTRSLQAGDLFVALKGDNFDGNAFLVQARDQGASAALCHGGAGLAQSGLPGIEVRDSKRALGQLAAAWRAQFTLPVIAVTGSNGKTTVTQMLAAILHAYKPAASLATQGNFNNDIGVPLTLLRLRPEHQIAVLELGMLRSFSSISLCASRATSRMSPISRIRLAIPSGRNGSRASICSPVPINLIGTWVTAFTLSRAPPRASPSNLVMITPSRDNASLNAFALLTASWPVMPSTTKNTC